MKILVLTPQMPFPPQQGTSLRNYHILRGLNERHQVELLTFNQQSGQSQVPAQLSFCTQIRVVEAPDWNTRSRLIKLITGPQPDIAHRLQSPLFSEYLLDMLAGEGSRLTSKPAYDIVQVEGLELASYISAIRRSDPAAKVVFDNHNAETELQRRAMLADLRTASRWPAATYSALQVRKLARFETWACRTADAVTVVSSADRQQIDKLVPGLRSQVIPNCIDVSAYRSQPEDNYLAFDLVFTGKMDYRPNVDAVLWFARHIWPLISARRPATTWAIVGQKPHARLTGLQKDKHITLTGWVEQVQPYLLGAKVSVMPFRVGSGTRLKLIEAMASGLAIVSTSIGAEGFPITNGKELLLADNPGDFAQAVLSLLENRQERIDLGKSAAAFAELYDWRHVIPLFDKVYDELA